MPGRERRRPPQALLVPVALVVGSVVLGCSSSPERSEKAFCGALEAALPTGDLLSRFAQAEPGEIDDTIDAFDGLADRAPDPIRADAEVIAGAVRAYGEAYAADPEDPFGGAGRPPGVDLARVAEASDAVVTYASSVCGVDLEPLGGGSTTVSAPSVVEPTG